MRSDLIFNFLTNTLVTLLEFCHYWPHDHDYVTIRFLNLILTLGDGAFLVVRGCLGFCRKFDSTSGLYWLDVSSLSLSCGKQKCLYSLPHVTGGTQLPHLWSTQEWGACLRHLQQGPITLWAGLGKTYQLLSGWDSGHWSSFQFWLTPGLFFMWYPEIKQWPSPVSPPSLFILFLFLRYDRHVTLSKFKVYNVMIWYIPTIVLAIPLSCHRIIILLLW